MSMAWGLTRTAEPTVEPVTLDEAKLHRRVDHSDEDSLISSLITAARQWVEEFTGRALVAQTWRLTFDNWPDGPYALLPRPPLMAIESIDYTDTDGVTRSVDESIYHVDGSHLPGRVVLADGASWPSATLRTAAAVQVTYTAGYGTEAADVPRPLRQAVLLQIGHLYEHRESVTVGVTGTDSEMPFATRALAWPYRAFHVGPV
jgi:uncharacterized phiE125 gp8 family phage protein